jgi:hypothetical protein
MIHCETKEEAKTNKVRGKDASLPSKLRDHEVSRVDSASRLKTPAFTKGKASDPSIKGLQFKILTDQQQN